MDYGKFMNELIIRHDINNLLEKFFEFEIEKEELVDKLYELMEKQK